ncbi:hypothetical protein [Paenisporosarcina sp. TG-14]|uniref:hypothetical protein n=1 Tax=Paenisporosarcina sp. TG-14 TaxID=1231057 RepID=UPI000311ACBA|nr:hypothetical protein [Paenisporosarcina sp. TG-14]
MQSDSTDNNSTSFSSPTSAVSAEETRILTEYMKQKNLFQITNHDESRRKPLILKQFFKMKRNQQVIVSSVVEDDKHITIEGKVASIGRDFVMITDLQKRTWIPYTAINSATIPFGFPTYSNTHQHFIYDNQLQQKLVLQFGETVIKKEALKQQFFEETLQTNLNSWGGMWVEVKTVDNVVYGKVLKTTKHELVLTALKKEVLISLHEIRKVSTLGFLQLWTNLVKSIFSK